MDRGDDITREEYKRKNDRYPSDLTDREWNFLGPLLPTSGCQCWQSITHLLVMSVRELEGRDVNPTAGIIDSQSVRTTESGEISGYDAGKKIKGRKRHIVTIPLV